MEKILVFIPAYNCEQQIGRVLAQLDATIVPLIGEVLVVDNTSRDRTVEEAQKAANQLQGIKVTIICNPENYGYGGSMKVGIDYAISKGFDYILILHGDDQADIRDFANVLSSRTYQNADLTMGARFHPHSKLIGYSKFRLYGNKLLNTLCSLCAMRRIYDLGSGLNLYKISSLQSLPYKKFPSDLTFDPQLLSEAIKRGYLIDFVPISWREEDQKSNAKIFRQGAHVLKMFVTHRLLGPLRRNYA